MRFPLAAALVLVSGAAQADCTHPAPVSFPAGATSVTIEDTPGVAITCYQLTAREGQRLTLSVTDDEHEASLELYAPGWQATCNADGDCEVSGDTLSEENEKSWADELPASGVYLIVVDNPKSDADYRLIVELR